MKKTITYQDQEQIIDVHKSSGHVEVTFGGKKFCFETRPTHDGWILQRDGQTFKTAFEQSHAGRHQISVNGSSITIEHQDPYALDGSGASAGAKGDIKAVMPGRVVKILVQEGDDVIQGEPVLVLEAMKMENEIKAPIDGKIEKICVLENASVESGAMLVNIQAV